MNTYGWKNVFKFTAIQMLKSKAFIISSVIIGVLMVAMGALVNIIPALVSADASSGEGPSAVSYKFKLVYMLDETGITSAENYKPLLDAMNVTVQPISSDQLESTRETVKTSSDSILVSLSRVVNTGVVVYVERPENSDISQGDVQNFSAVMKSFYQNIRLGAAGLDEESSMMISEPVYTLDSIAGKEPVPEFVIAIKSTIPQVVSMILFLMVFVYGMNIAQSVAQEKTSKVLELLLTSIKPLAIIIGKVLGMGLLSFAQFIAFIVLGAGSFIATTPLAPKAIAVDSTGNELLDLVSSNDFMSAIGKALEGFNTLNIILIIFIFIIGFLFYALVAGLFGAGISRIEDLSSGMQPYSLIGLLGFYLAFFSASLGVLSDTITTPELISLYLPISSPFAISSMLITGRISVVESIVPIIVLCAFDIIMALFVARVYEQVILHSGNSLKIKDFFAIAKNK